MLQPRPPIVVILGHVDHGKTTLLDTLRKSNVAAKEAGGITQSTRAFQVNDITFIDTPGHAAFSQMRSRGSVLADIAVLVVAADDGVMPQTKESLEAIKSANIPYIVAINKIDLPSADINRIKSQLAEEQVFVEGFGGQTPVVDISAKTGVGLPDLLEMLSLVASLNPPQADSAASPESIVLESHHDPKKGPLATVVVKNGTLSEGQLLYSGLNQVGKARALSDTAGNRITSALPSTPVEIFGLSSVPPVGSTLTSQPTSIISPLESKGMPAGRGDINIILKADVLGSLEAITNSLPGGINVISSTTGDISKSDILMSQTTSAKIIGFNVKIPSGVAKLAETEKIKVYTFNIIYELLEAVEKLSTPQIKETIIGRAQILAEFKIEGQRVAGCKCLEGEIAKTNIIKIGDKQTRVKSLKVGKTEVERVKSPQEFGAVFFPYLDFKVGDHIIALTND